MVYTPLLVVCVAITRPLGGWMADHFDSLKILGWMFGIMVILALVMAMQISLEAELFAIYGLALLAGAAVCLAVGLATHPAATHAALVPDPNNPNPSQSSSAPPATPRRSSPRAMPTRPRAVRWCWSSARRRRFRRFRASQSFRRRSSLRALHRARRRR